MKKYQVPLIPQTKSMGCWSASMAMILSWRDLACYSSEQVAAACGYTQQREAGLNPEDTGPFKHWGFEWLAPQSITVQGFYQLLVNHGPLWVATLTPAPHIRVVTGMEPDPDPRKAKLHINDPWPMGKGAIYIEKYNDFVGKKDNLAVSEMKIKAPVYTAHLK